MDGHASAAAPEVGAAPELPPGIRVWPATFCSQATRAKVLQASKYRREDLNHHDLAVTEF